MLKWFIKLPQKEDCPLSVNH